MITDLKTIALERFWPYVDKDGPIMPGMPDECWIWSRQPSNEYGQISVGGRDINIHVFSWLLIGGPKTTLGFLLHHKCANKRCVRPSHLVMETIVGHAEQHKLKRKTKGGINLSETNCNCKNDKRP